MRATDSQIHDLIIEAHEDEVGLWFVIAKVRDELDITDAATLRDTAMNCVRQLLESGEVRAGYYRPDGSGVETWDLAPEDVISRIESSWNALGREPDIGEVAVFVGIRQS